MQGATVLFTAELLLPSGNRIELIGRAPIPLLVGHDHAVEYRTAMVEVQMQDR